MKHIHEEGTDERVNQKDNIEYKEIFQTSRRKIGLLEKVHKREHTRYRDDRRR